MADHTITLTTEEVSFVLNVLHVDGHGHKSSRADFEPECPSCTAAAKLEALESSDGVALPPAPLLQQALEALELSQPLPGNEAKWSAAINAIYAAMAAGVETSANPDSARVPAWDRNGMVRALVMLSRALRHKPGATVDAREGQCVEAALIELAATRLAASGVREDGNG